jgi:hypothetical protein
VIRIGIVGHRVIEAGAATEFVMDQCEAVLRRARNRHAPVLALSAAAEGADTIFAETALRLGVRLELVRPFRGYVDDFADPEARRRYAALRTGASRETALRFERRSTSAYLAAMRWIAERSDVLVAAWDGAPAARRGGTADAVRHARRLGRPVVHVDVVRRTTTVAA